MKKMMDSTTVIITTTDNRVLLQKRDENPDIEYSPDIILLFLATLRRRKPL